MGKRDGLLLSILIGIILLASFVSAQGPVEALKDLFQGTKEVMTSLAEALFGPGPMGFGGEGLFAKSLIFLIVLVVAWAIFSKIEIVRTNTWFVAILSISIALLSTRFLLDPDWIRVILLPYSAFGIALATFFPLFLYFYFVEFFLVSSRILRRAAWIFAAIVFIGFWFTRASEIESGIIFIYPLAAVACGLFFWFDGTIQGIINKIKAEKTFIAISYGDYGFYMEKIKSLKETLRHLPPTDVLWPKIKKQIDEYTEKAKLAYKDLNPI